MANIIPLAVADLETQISTPIEIGDVAFSITSATDDDGTALPAGKYCFTVDNGKSNKEYLLGQLNGTDVTSVVSVSRQGVESSGAVFAHRVGANAVITDFATIQRVADILRGQEPLDGSNPLYYDAEPTLSGREELATVGYVLDNITGGTVSFDKQTTTGVAGEDLVAGDLIYFKTSDQEWYKTDGADADTLEGVQLGIALGTGSDGVAITNGIQLSGAYTTTGLTAGATYYASNTKGAISATAGTIQKIVGLALSTNRILLTNMGAHSPMTLSSYVPTGALLPFSGATAPAGYLVCDGSAVSRTTYSKLFATISDMYGEGNGSTTFNIPDLRGSIPVGVGQKTRTVTVDYTPRTALPNITNFTTVGNITFASNHGLSVGNSFYISSGALTNLSNNVLYYVISVVNTTNVRVSLELNGSQIANPTNNRTGTATTHKNGVVQAPVGVPDIYNNMVVTVASGTLPTGLTAKDYFAFVFGGEIVLSDTVLVKKGRILTDETARTVTLNLVYTGNRVLGQQAGEEAHVLSVAEMPSHTHDQRFTGNSGSSSLGSAGDGNWSPVITNKGIQNTGGNQAHNNLQPYIVLNYIIKT